MTTFVRDDLVERSDGNGATEICTQSFRMSYEDVGSCCWYKEGNHTIFIPDVLFESIEKENGKTPEDLIQKAFHIVCGGHIACKISLVQGGYTLYVSNREVAREIGRTLEKELFYIPIHGGTERRGSGKWEWRDKKNILFLAICFFIAFLAIGIIFEFF